jgi:hypothetical protein
MKMKDLDAMFKAGLKGQYHAAIQELRSAVERCSEKLWMSGDPAFWQVAYHALFYTHFYLMPSESDFVPWEKGREEYHFLGTLPWPPHSKPKLGESYSKREILEYVLHVEQAVDRLDLTAESCGFPWYPLTKAEHQILNVRHLQNHASHLAARMKHAGEIGAEWVSI